MECLLHSPCFVTQPCTLETWYRKMDNCDVGVEICKDECKCMSQWLAAETRHVPSIGLATFWFEAGELISMTRSLGTTSRYHSNYLANCTVGQFKYHLMDDQ